MAKMVRFGFGAGIMDKDLGGRVDVDSYHRGCSELVNFELLENGSVRRRYASRWLADLPSVPVAMETFVWSSGAQSVFCIFDTQAVLYGIDGEEIQRWDYDCADGKPRFNQINDLVIVTNRGQFPYELKALSGGEYSFGPISFLAYPVTGSWDHETPLTFASGKCYVGSGGWDDSYEWGSTSGSSVASYTRENDRSYTFYPANYTAYDVLLTKAGQIDETYLFGYDDAATTKYYTYQNQNPLRIIQQLSGAGTYTTDFIDYYWTPYICSNRPVIKKNYYNNYVTRYGSSWIKVNAGETVEMSYNSSFHSGDYWGWMYNANAQYVSNFTFYRPIGYGTRTVVFDSATYLRLFFRTIYSTTNPRLKGTLGLRIFKKVENNYSGDTSGSTENWVSKNGETFRVGDIIAVRRTISERRSTMSMSAYGGASLVDLTSNNYAVGKHVYGAKADGNLGFWTCIKAWTKLDTAATSTDCNMYPDYFEPGISMWTGLVGGAYTLSGTCSSYFGKWAIQYTQDGTHWTTLQEISDNASSGTNVTLSGNNDGEPLQMRVAFIECTSSDTSSAMSTFKKTWVANKFDYIFYLKIDSFNELGYFNYTVLNSASLFGDGTDWDWDYLAFCRENGYPVASAYHAGRLVFAGTKAQPMTLWFSQQDDLYNFRTGTNSSDSMTLTGNARRQSEIAWMASNGGVLVVGTTDGEFTVSSGDEALSSDSASAEFYTNCGSDRDSDVLLATDALMFIDRSGTRLRRLSYTQASEFYSATDLSIYSRGTLTGNCVDECWQRAPQPVAWMIPGLGDNAGKLVGMLYNPDQQINAWFIWESGDGEYKRCCCTATGEKVDPMYVAVEHSDGNCTLEVFDWDEGNINDCHMGQVSYNYEATLTTTPLDTSDYFGEKGGQSTLKFLVDGVDFAHHNISVSCGSEWTEIQVPGDTGWVQVQGLTDGQYVRQVGLKIGLGHGMVLAGTLGN